MVSANNYRITIQDFDLPVAIGFEHYVIGVERLDTATNKWIVEAEFNGLATSSDQTTIKSIGFGVAGDQIKTYLKVNENGELYKKGYLDNSNIPDSKNTYFLDTINGGIKKSTDGSSLKTVYQGTESQVLNFVSGMIKAGNAINNADYAYQFPNIDNFFYHTQNSNRTAFTLIEAGLIATGTSADSKTAILDSITRWDAPGSGKSFDLGDSFWDSVKPVETPLMPYAPLHDNPYLYFTNEQLGQLSQTGEIDYTPYETMTIGDEIVYVFKKTSEVIIDGVTHTAGAIVEAYEVAEKSLEQFAETYKGSINLLSNALSSALTKTFAELGALVASNDNRLGCILQNVA